MNKSELQNKFIEAIMKKLPSNELLVSYISRIINLGKEAAYRRIRGQVEFSFSEVLTIIEDLDIPFLELTSNKSEYVIFRPYLAKKKSCTRICNQFEESYRGFKKYPTERGCQNFVLL